MITKISDKEYFSTEAMSYSFLKNFDITPAHAFVKKSSQSLTEGSILHEFILDEKHFNNNYFFAPDDVVDKRTKQYKLLCEQNKKTCLIHREWEALVKQKANLYEFKFEKMLIGDILEIAQKEISIFWDINVDGCELNCKGKIDFFWNNIIFDIKTTADMKSFVNDIYKYEYYRQDAWYSAGIHHVTVTGALPRFIFLAIEKNEPYGVKAFELDWEYKALGIEKNYKTIEKYIAWDGNKKTLYNNEIEIIKRPKW